ncbi:MAG: D-amino-acid transaminase [Paracoccaceae bacterium]
MSRTVYVNGDYVAEEDAKISVFDRAFLMADGVYEVTAVLDGKLCEYAGHMTRLKRSLDALEMRSPVTEDELLEIHRELVRRNDVQEGGVYLQITRGEGDRDFVWPKDAEPGIVLFTQARPVSETPAARSGIKVIAAEDQRWGRRDIKTVQLLYPSWAKMMAKGRGKDDAWLVEDGFVTEGSSNNAYIVTKQGTIVTRQLSNDILHGITRSSVLRVAKEAQMKIEERPFTIAEAQDAAEAFITSASTFVCPVVEIEDETVAEGAPGPVTQRLREIYMEEARANAI